MEYIKSYNQMKWEEGEYNRKGCFQFILFFLMMVVCIAIIVLTQK